MELNADEVNINGKRGEDKRRQKFCDILGKLR